MKKLLSILLAMFLGISCSDDVEIVYPTFVDGSILAETVPVPAVAKIRMSGVYQIQSGNNVFGDVAVIVWNDPDFLSIFCQKAGTYLALKGGVKDSTFVFEGTWRKPFGTETGLARILIPKDGGGRELLANSATGFTVIFSGLFAEGNEKPNKSITCRYVRPFSQTVLQDRYIIVGHRGGGRNSDYIGVSENTTRMIALARQRGCNAIEIDVKLSKDGIPFVYHDADINLRLVDKSIIWGEIEEFTFDQLRALITLKHGERIQSLKFVLEFVLNYTNLKLVWLDMKSDKDDLSYVIPIQNEILAKAKASGRNLQIVIGLPTDEKADQLLAYPDYGNVNVLCELDPEIVRQTDAEIWGPRWTLGTQSAEVEAMHNEGRQVITWTLDDPAWIRKYIDESKFDGILTNYPSVVFYSYYVQKN